MFNPVAGKARLRGKLRIVADLTLLDIGIEPDIIIVQSQPAKLGYGAYIA
jgi:hypothetical protein